LALLALGAGALVATGAARAGNVAWSVGIAAPGVQVGLASAPQVYVQPGPVYVQPAPVYVQPGVSSYDQAPVYGAATPDYPAPSYYGYSAPAPVYYGAAPAYIGAVAPVVYAPPVVYRPRPVVVVRPAPPIYRHGYGHGYRPVAGPVYRPVPYAGAVRAGAVYGGPVVRPGPYR